MSAESYLPAIKAMGLVELAGADLGYYQGDYVMLVKDGEYSTSGRDFGLLVIGYGSCSGCDTWQAADGPAERAKAVLAVLEQGKWFETLDEAKAYITSDDELLKWHAHEEGWAPFVADVQAVAS
jgi:hypothetical protein